MAHDWEEYYALQDPEVALQMIEDRIRTQLNIMRPQKEFKVREELDPLMKVVRRTKQPLDWVAARQETE